MTLQELNAYAIAGKIDEMNLISVDGVIYVLEARMHGSAYPLRDTHGEIVHLRSVEHARDMLHAFPKLSFNITHASVHDEMCGASTEEGLKIPITFRSV
ncbi:DUF6482 family protein [Pseudomonas sp. S2_A02]